MTFPPTLTHLNSTLAVFWGLNWELKLRELTLLLQHILPQHIFCGIWATDERSWVDLTVSHQAAAQYEPLGLRMVKGGEGEKHRLRNNLCVKWLLTLDVGKSIKQTMKTWHLQRDTKYPKRDATGPQNNYKETKKKPKEAQNDNKKTTETQNDYQEMQNDTKKIIKHYKMTTKGAECQQKTTKRHKTTTKRGKKTSKRLKATTRRCKMSVANWK